jgi:hypothetical protein
MFKFQDFHLIAMENARTVLKNTFVTKNVSQPFCHATESVNQAAFKTVLAIVNQIGT